VDVGVREELQDRASAAVYTALREAGLPGLRSVRLLRVYLLETTSADLKTLMSEGRRLLADPICEVAEFSDGSRPADFPRGRQVVLVLKKPGVMDPVEQSALKAFRDLGIELSNFRSGHKYVIESAATPEQLRRTVLRAFANEVVDEVTVGERAFDSLRVGGRATFERVTVPIRGGSSERLMEISRERILSLDTAEMRAIQDYFEREGRDPTDCELETLAQTWSEHCKHKTFRSDIVFDGRTIPNLLKSTVFKATSDLARPWCLSVFKDNAGIVEFDDRDAVCFKVETHNHPSAIEPYGGANTGLGGVIRDVLGCGLGGKPVANVDVFAVGRPDTPESELPPGVIHPRRLLKSVVAGVRDYGNRMGIPTVSGAVVFDPRYVANPLVFCGTVGLIPKDRIEKGAREGDLIALIGGRTGRDGIHGATFSSLHLDQSSETVSQSAVQIGNAIVEKKVLDAVLDARDRGLYTCITDCGAGGLSSAVGEMAGELGAEVELGRVPLKYDGLTYTEIWISEAQERMVLSVPPEKMDELRSICDAHDVELSVLGKFGAGGRLRIDYREELVCDLDVKFLHDGLPQTVRAASWKPPQLCEPKIFEPGDYEKELIAILGHPDVASKEWIIRQYDHEVQGGSVVKSLVGPGSDGPSDGVILRPKLDSARGLAIGLGIHPRAADIDPYAMAGLAIDEAMRNVVAVGGDPSRTSLLDNFCWGGPNDPEVLGALVRAAQGCYDVALGLGTPFISGKDSLNNEFRHGDRLIRIPHTLLISAMAIVPDVQQAATTDLKFEGDALILVGMTRAELGAGLFYQKRGHLGARVPVVDPAVARRTFERLHQAIRSGLVRACHDLSEGGLAVAAAEMAMGGDLGAELSLADVPTDAEKEWQILFSESASRFLVEVASPKVRAFRDMMADVPNATIGTVIAAKRLRVLSREGRELMSADLARLKEAWKAPLAW
jgi:phosphoribosylformylglycinamidine synthase